VFDAECEQGLLGHLNEAEFLSRHGLHSLSKRDPAYDHLDLDNGGSGICTSFPPQIIERLYQAGRPELAADVLQRLLWWGDSLPYWGDSVLASARDYRRDTPLQCTLDGVAGAQCAIFGVFGISVRPGGDVVVRPHALPFARKLALRGVEIRGRRFDVQVADGRVEVRAGPLRERARLGQAVVIPAGDAPLRTEE